MDIEIDPAFGAAVDWLFEKHREVAPTDGQGSYCRTCDLVWPCPTAALLLYTQVVLEAQAVALSLLKPETVKAADHLHNFTGRLRAQGTAMIEAVERAKL